jgi:O-antigen ligase
MAHRYIAPAMFLLLLLSMWVPAEELKLPSWTEQARYLVFLMLSGWIVVVAFIKVGLRIPSGIECTLLAAFLLYVSFSAVWGVQSADSYIKAILIFNALVTSLAIANTLTLEQSLRVMFAALSTFVVVCVLVALLVPSIGVDSSWEHAGKWRGIAGQKNGLAAYAAYALIAGVGLPLRQRVTPLAQWGALVGRIAMVGIALLAVYMAGSRGGQLISVLGVASIVISRLPKLLQRLALLTGLLFAIPIINLVSTTFVVDADKIGVAGITVDTNSRMKIWSYGFRELQGREIFGFGLDSFWTPERLTSFKSVYGWVLDNFHNGYITLIIEGGIAGFLLFLAALSATYLLLVVSVGNVRDKFIGLSFAYVNMYTVNNLVENEIGRSTSLLIFIFLILVFSIRRQVYQHYPGLQKADAAYLHGGVRVHRGRLPAPT